MTQEDKPVAIILPTWNPNEPRFIVEDAHDGLADDRAFKNGKCVYNQRLGIVYTVEYVVDALNELGDEIDKLKEENEQLRQENKELQNKIDWLCEQTGYDGAKFHTIEDLKKQLEEKEQEERLYAQEILKLNKTKEQILNFKKLGGEY